MRSYHAHLKSLIGTDHKKPIFRSSAIFPVFEEENIHSRVLFMGYWVLKRNISEMTAVYTLRSQEGAVLKRRSEPIQTPQPYTIEVRNLLNSTEPFTGSLECEFYSSQPLVFPFPATVINYYGKVFSAVVHTAQRIYNDFDDMANNSVQKVPESGFTLYADERRQPFVSLINGCEHIENCEISFTFYNSQGESLDTTYSAGEVKPYQTLMINPSEICNLKFFLGGNRGAAKVQFQLPWVYPRLIVGNRDLQNQSLSITHTYYDCSKATDNSDYWRPENSHWNPASLMVPFFKETTISFYPIYSPSNLAIDLQLYDSDGYLLLEEKNVLEIQSPSEAFYTLTLNEKYKINSKNLGARLITRSKDHTPIPARIKIGYDVGTKGQTLPCNICTNLQPFLPEMDKKPRTFKWAPILADQPRWINWIVNSSPQKDYNREATVKLTFYRKQDGQLPTAQGCRLVSDA